MYGHPSEDSAQCQLSREIAEKNNDYEMLESIAVFERQTTRMKGLIEQLLQMSILEKNKINLSVEDVDLLDVVESVCDDAVIIRTSLAMLSLFRMLTSMQRLFLS